MKNKTNNLRVCLLTTALALLVALTATPAYTAVTKEQVKEVSGDLVCYCGCANKVVSTCGCGTADQIEADIKAQLESGKSKEDIVAAYVAQHGEQGLATPIPKGFNVTAWLMPIVAIMAGGFVIRTLVVRWRARARTREDNPVQNAAPVEQVRRQDQILRELEELE